MTVLEAHLLCLALVAADLLARTWRIQWFVRGLGHRLTAREAFTLNAWGDAACALTPLRFGGEPARLAGMLRSRVPASAAFVAIGFEVLASWPVIIVFAGALAWRFAPEWWAEAGPMLAATARRMRVWFALVVLVSGLAWIAGRQLARVFAHQVRRPVARVGVYWRRMPLWPILASVPCSVVNIVARVAILPVLALTLPHPPEIGPAALGSFALLYSQLVLPTPSGAGAVELGFLGGAAGDLGENGWLLLAWRFYTNGVGVVLGVWLAAHELGWPALKELIRRIGRREAEPAPPA
jgi:uncharacterized membrane protein YbhN (UPF0104 family)